MNTKRNLLWVHWIPTHDPNPYLDYIRKLQPGGVKIVNFDVSQVSQVYQACPTAYIMLRNHTLSEQKAEMYADPIGTANKHAAWWKDRIEELYRQAAERGLPMPPIEQLILLGVNEAEVWSHLIESIIYNTHFLDNLTVLGYIGGALNLNVGWPANTGTDTPPDWTDYAPIHDALVAGGHFLILHEYWGAQSLDLMWGWHAGRFTKCPWQDVKIIIGECGVDNHVDDGKGNRGWKHFMSAAEYATQVEHYIYLSSQDKRFVGGALFTSDYGSRDWESFNSLEAHSDLLTKNYTYETSPEPEKPYRLFLPFVTNYPVSQKFGENPQFYSPLKGHTGIDFACPIGTPVMAVDDGTITEVYELTQLGRYIKIVHSWGESVYLHLSEQLVVPNQIVKGGEKIGLSGNTGRSSGPHLHFGIRVYPYDRNDGWDGYSDPTPYLYKSAGVIEAPTVPIEKNESESKIFRYLAQEGTTLEITTQWPITVKVNNRYTLILNP